MPKPSDILTRPIIKGGKIVDLLETDQNSSSTQIAGRTTVLSGTTTITVSTTNVKSDSLVRAIQAQTSNASHDAIVYTVASQVDGAYFTIRANAATVDDQDVGWILHNTLTGN